MVALPASAPVRAAIYRRVSTTEQEENCSLANQAKQARTYVALHGYTLVADESDVATGYKLTKRPGLDAIRRLVAARAVDVVIVWRLDRLTRRLYDAPKLLDEWEQHDVSLRSVMEEINTSTPVGKHIVMTLAFIAEQERDTFRLRSETGRRNRAESGKPLVGRCPPYGYRWVLSATPNKRGHYDKVALEPDPVTAPIAVRIWEELEAGVTMRALCLRLMADGIPTANGRRQWDKSTFERMLRNGLYWGQPTTYRHVWREETRTDKHGITRTVKALHRYPQGTEHAVALPATVAPALVSSEVAAAAHARMARNTHTAPRRTDNPQAYLLRGGYVRCARCGRVMSVRKDHATREYRCVTARNRPGLCAYHRIAQRPLDEAIWSWVSAVLREPAIIAQAVADQQAAEGGDPTAQRRAQAERRRDEIARQQANLAGAVATLGQGEATAPLLALLEQLAPQAREAQADLDALERERTAWASAQAQLAQVMDWCQTVAANLATLTYEERQTALEWLDVRVKVYPADMGEPVHWRATMRPLGSAARSLSSADLAAISTPSLSARG